MKQTKRRIKTKLFAALFAVIMCVTLCLAGCGAADKAQAPTNGQAQQNEELTELVDAMEQELDEIGSLVKELGETNSALKEQLSLQEEANAELADRIEWLQNGLLVISDLDFTKEHAQDMLCVYVNEEYAGKELTAEDFLTVDVIDVSEPFVSLPHVYYLTFDESGDANLLKTAIQLYSLGFVEQMDLVAILSGA